MQQSRNLFNKKFHYESLMGSCFYEYVVDCSIKTNTAHLKDFSKYSNKVISIEVLNASVENQGYGSKILLSILEKYKGIPIILMAGPADMSTLLKIEDNKIYKKEFYSRLKYFYEKNGFIDVSAKIGHYNNYLTMYNSNSSGIII